MLALIEKYIQHVNYTCKSYTGMSEDVCSRLNKDLSEWKYETWIVVHLLTIEDYLLFTFQEEDTDIYL